MGGSFSLSKADLAEFCVFAFTKNAPDWPKVLKPIDSRINRAFHWVCAQVINSGTPADLINQAILKHNLEPKHREKLTAMRPLQHAAQFRDRYPITGSAEVALAYDWETGDCRVLGRDIGRDYILGPTEFGSTLDCFGTDNESDLGFVLEIVDWKTGQRAKERVTRAAGNRQLGGLSMMMSRIVEVDTIRQVIAFVSEDGFCERDEYIADPVGDTNETESWIQDVIGRIKANEKPNPGSHCIECYCPLFGACPETMGAYQAIERDSQQSVDAPPKTSEQTELSMIVLDPLKFRSDEHAAWAINRAQAAKKLAEQIIEAGKAYVDTKETRRIPLTNGKFWGAGTMTVPHVEVKGTEKIEDFKATLISEIGEERFRSSVLTKVSAEDLKAALGSDNNYRKVITSLRKAGFVRDEHKTEYKAHKFAEPKKG